MLKVTQLLSMSQNRNPDLSGSKRRALLIPLCWELEGPCFCGLGHAGMNLWMAGVPGCGDSGTGSSRLPVLGIGSMLGNLTEGASYIHWGPGPGPLQGASSNPLSCLLPLRPSVWEPSEPSLQAPSAPFPSTISGLPRHSKTSATLRLHTTHRVTCDLEAHRSKPCPTWSPCLGLLSNTCPLPGTHAPYYSKPEPPPPPGLAGARNINPLVLTNSREFHGSRTGHLG